MRGGVLVNIYYDADGCADIYGAYQWWACHWKGERSGDQVGFEQPWYMINEEKEKDENEKDRGNLEFI